MRNHGFVERVLLALVLVSLLLSSIPLGMQAQAQGNSNGKYAEKVAKTRQKQEQRVTPQERQAAADRAAEAGFTPIQGTVAAQAGQAPRYFSHPNYANSPLPEPNVSVTIGGAGTGATAKAIMIGPAGEILAIVVTNPGSGYLDDGTTTVTIVDIAGTATIPAEAQAIIDPGTGAVIGINVNVPGEGYSIAAGTGMEKFVDPLPWAPGGDPMPVATMTPMSDGTQYVEIGLVQYRQQMHRDLPSTLLRGYVQLAPCGGTSVPLFNEMLDGSKVATGYCGVSAPSYLGPIIVAQKDIAVRILFRNLLPAGEGGNLFIPTDVSVMGAGMGPDLHGMPEVDPLHPTCEAIPKPVGCFTENRADLHLHGGLTPWISDGTPHQWITPAGETLPYPDANLLADPNAPDHKNAVENKGVSVEYVPDMWYDGSGNWIQSCFGSTTCNVPGATNNPGRGAQTYYYTNQQSARLLFYHDHAWGITRLNVYAGEAAGYLIQDDVEAGLQAGALSGLGIGIPLVIQDKTFVPSPEQIAVSDETWDYARWGGLGNLWLPHVYSPAQNPGDSSGVNQFGRWAYGPWFWPPTQDIAYGPVPNPYYDPACDPDVQWCEPPLMPGTPYNSMGMEAFHDTPVVNGKAYPTVTLDPGEYRFRILNAASDRSFNLSIYVADASGKEVQLNPDEVAAALLDPTIFPTPVVGTEGPAWIQIGTEGGFLPAPVVVENQPTTWVTDPTVFNAGNVDKHALLLGPAERADVVVDLTPFAGMTLILYNDAPAAFPARDPRYDYYTGSGDYRDTGGAPSTLPGYGPNTRTVMQIVVTGSGGAAIPNYVNTARLGALQTAFKATSLGGGGVFENGQHPIIVGQGAYNSAYGTNFVNNGPLDGLARITDFSLTFRTLYNWQSNNTMTMSFGTKAIQDEMGEAFDRDYGRMSGNLGLEVPLVGGPLQNLILYPYVNPVSELINSTSLPKGNLQVAPISVASDGTQIWKITHNGVDTHPIHFHLFDVQLLNRVGWDGIIRKPDLNELGWKDTVRISPLEDTIVALRPVVPVTPFDAAIPNSTRPLNPAMPTGSSLMFTNVDANANPTEPIVNVWTNFGWEYVWHCHILSHEEMDMMRPISVSAPPAAASNLSGLLSGGGNNRSIILTWTDNSITETGFTIQKAPMQDGPWTDLATVPANVTTYTDVIGNAQLPLYYRVVASNQVGYGFTPGYSTVTTSSTSNVAMVGQLPPPPAAPTNLTAVAQAGPQVLLTWRDNANNETGFVVERATGNGPFSFLVTVGPRAGTGNVSYTDVTVVAGATYSYRVAAVNGGGQSVYSNTATVTIPAPPAPPSNVTATVVRRNNNSARVGLSWTDNSNNEQGFRIQQATNPEFTANLVTVTVAANQTTWTSGNLARNTPYYFRVQSYNGAGPSIWVNATPFPINTQ